MIEMLIDDTLNNVKSMMLSVVAHGLFGDRIPSYPTMKFGDYQEDGSLILRDHLSRKTFTMKSFPLLHVEATDHSIRFIRHSLQHGRSLDISDSETGSEALDIFGFQKYQKALEARGLDILSAEVKAIDLSLTPEGHREVMFTAQTPDYSGKITITRDEAATFFSTISTFRSAIAALLPN